MSMMSSVMFLTTGVYFDPGSGGGSGPRKPLPEPVMAPPGWKGSALPFSLAAILLTAMGVIAALL